MSVGPQGDHSFENKLQYYVDDYGYAPFLPSQLTVSNFNGAYSEEYWPEWDCNTPFDIALQDSTANMERCKYGLFTLTEYQIKQRRAYLAAATHTIGDEVEEKVRLPVIPQGYAQCNLDTGITSENQDRNPSTQSQTPLPVSSDELLRSLEEGSSTIARSSAEFSNVTFGKQVSSTSAPAYLVIENEVQQRKPKRRSFISRLKFASKNKNKDSSLQETTENTQASTYSSNGQHRSTTSSLSVSRELRFFSRWKKALNEMAHVVAVTFDQVRHEFNDLPHRFDKTLRVKKANLNV